MLRERGWEPRSVKAVQARERHRRRGSGGRRIGPRAWGLFVDLIDAWYRQHGDVQFSSGSGAARVGNFDLSQMAKRVRRAYRNDLLTPEQVSKLERYKGWRWDPYLDQFKARLRALRAALRARGEASVPRELRGGDGRAVRPAEKKRGRGDFGLASWWAHVRASYRAGKLRPELARAFEGALGKLPGFRWRKKAVPGAEYEGSTAERLMALDAFVKREGHARVPQNHVEKGIKLGVWVMNLRRLHDAGRLPATLARKLAKYPRWSWGPWADAHATFMRKLRRYVRREGHACVPQNHVEDGYRLGWRVGYVRKRYLVGKGRHYRGARRRPLPAAIARDLEALPGWEWNAVRRA